MNYSYSLKCTSRKQKQEMALGLVLDRLHVCMVSRLSLVETDSGWSRPLHSHREEHWPAGCETGYGSRLPKEMPWKQRKEQREKTRSNNSMISSKQSKKAFHCILVTNKHRFNLNMDYGYQYYFIQIFCKGFK